MESNPNQCRAPRRSDRTESAAVAALSYLQFRGAVLGRRRSINCHSVCRKTRQCLRNGRRPASSAAYAPSGQLPAIPVPRAAAKEPAGSAGQNSTSTETVCSIRCRMPIGNGWTGIPSDAKPSGDDEQRKEERGSAGDQPFGTLTSSASSRSKRPVGVSIVGRCVLFMCSSFCRW